MKNISTTDIVATIIFVSIVAGVLVGFARSVIEGVACSWHSGRLRAEREHEAQTARTALHDVATAQPLP